MRGYASREPQKRPDELTVSRETTMSLFSVVEQIQLLGKLSEKTGNKYERLNSAWSGVTWVATVKRAPGIWVPISLISVIGLRYNFKDHDVHPIPVEQFLAVPLVMQGALKVGLIVQFHDCVAARVISEKLGDITEIMTNARIGDTLDMSDTSSLVNDFSKDSFVLLDL